ncbi:hypothetical protein GGR54DRAFT_182129 [Hypoxylon sp. NC1633]|nr:hypothetical protein GGR54DRAFT_182129 [Hypoxylon sp. NC1633]
MAKISGLKKERGNTNTTSRFGEVEDTMAEFRLACMNVIAHDFEYAAGKNVENFLWQVHIYLNGEYRKVISRLMTQNQVQNQVVVRRKLEKLYRAFLKTSQSFYRVYIQQLSARFYIPELHQVAQGTDVQPELSPAPDSTAPSELRTLILKSCQINLVHLGDLFRYRCQMSEKPSITSANFDKALEYYTLANAVDPDDGSAHHQLAVLYQLQGQHLDIVYHFHRSICIENPYSLGVANLEREFKGLESSSSARNGHVKDPNQTMITWFLRLHAYYFLGEPFSAQSELEKEVLHRIEMAMKSDTDEGILRKIIFVNIAAYDIALEKVRSAWTIQGSQSAQFLLRFNIRTALTVVRLLKAGLLDEYATYPTPEGEGEGKENEEEESPICFSETTMRLLPLFRIYISWIYVSCADIDKYREFLEPYVSDVYRLLADTLTLLNKPIDEAVATTSSKYLLPEDAEAIGLKPFRDENLPLFLQADDLPGLNPLKKQKACKPRNKAAGRQYNPHTEAMWRIRDIVYCGILLAGTSSYPLALTIEPHDEGDTQCWDFTDEASSQQLSIDEVSMSRMLNKLRLGDTKPRSEKELDPTPSGMNGDEVLQSHDDSDDDTDDEPQHRPNKGKSIEAQAPNSILDTDLSGDSEMVNMVNKLLDPDDDDDSRPRSSETQADTSYGMNTTTANEIFGRFVTDSSQPSPVSKTIPNLPWGYFYEPRPRRSTSQGTNHLAPDGDFDAPTGTYGQLDGFESSCLPKNLGMSTTQAPAYLHAGESIAHVSPQFSQGHTNKKSGGSLELSRSSVLDSLTSALYAQHGLSQSKGPRSDGLASRAGASPFGLQRPTSGMLSSSPFLPATGSPYLGNLTNDLGSSYMEHSASQHASQGNLQSPDQVGQGRPTSRYGGFHNPAEHPRTQNVPSPMGKDVGLPPPGTQRSLQASQVSDLLPTGPFQQQYSPWAQEPQINRSSIAFSHPSSLYTGTPAALPRGPLAGPPDTAFFNGDIYNASPPFNRVVLGHDDREDFTHFRNLGPVTMNADAYSYDQQISEAALLDDDQNPR